MTKQHITACEDAEMYMLGGLNEEEKQAFELHLPHCPECREKVEELAAVVSILPRAVEQIEPPKGMKERILAAVARSAEEARETAPAEPLSLTTESLDAIESIKRLSDNKGLNNAASLESPDVNRKRWMMRVITGVAAAFILLSGFLIARVNQLNGETAALSEQVNNLQSQIAAAENPMAGTQVSNIVNLSPAASDIIAQGLATIVIDDKGMHLIVQAENLPKLTNDEAFQVWLLKEGKPVNAGTFLTHDGTGALYYTFQPDEYDQIAITHEPDAHGSEPRGTIVLAGALGQT